MSQKACYVFWLLKPQTQTKSHIRDRKFSNRCALLGKLIFFCSSQVCYGFVYLKKVEILNCLKEAFVHEQQNSMVYIRNSFVIRDCDPSRVTEAIAVDEMRHM